MLGEALAVSSDRVVIATKLGFGIHEDGSRYNLDSGAEHMSEVVDESLRRLKTEHIKLL